MVPSFLPALELSIDEESGAIRAAYLRVRAGQVDETHEVAEGKVFADYDAKGALLGIELLAPCAVEILENIAAQEPEPIKRFLRGGAPRELVPA